MSDLDRRSAVDAAVDAAMEEDLSAWLDGELPPERESELRARLAAEPALATRLAALEQVDAALRSLPRPDPGTLLQTRLRSRLAAEGLRPRSAHWLRPRAARSRAVWLGAAFAAAAAAVLALVVARSRVTTGVEPPAGSGQSLAEGGQTAVDLDHATDEEIGIALDYETLADLDVIENLDLLERMAALDDGGRS